MRYPTREQRLWDARYDAEKRKNEEQPAVCDGPPETEESGDE